MNRKGSSRRSQRRLGRQYHTTAASVRLNLVPALQSGRLARVIAILLLGLVVWSIYTVFSSPRFYVFGANIEGTVVIPPDEIYDASGLEGMSVFWIDPQTIEQQIEALPNVKSARVKVRLPARANIKIEERAPVLVWQTNETQWWIDAEGVVIPSRTGLQNPLTVINTDGQPLAVGDQVDVEVLAAVRALGNRLPGLSTMYYSPTTGISFKSAEGWPIYLGDGQRLDTKLTVLLSLRKYLLAQGVTPEFIDVRYVERPFYK